MNIKLRMTAVAVAATALVVGCTPTDISFGNSVRQTMAAQVVNPDPQYENPIPTTDASKSAEAVKRYRTDKVKQPDAVRTTTGISQGGSPR